MITLSQKKIPLYYVDTGEEEVEVAARVIRSGWLSQGKKVEEFEKKFAEYIGSKYAIAVSSGTAALHVALASMNINPGGEVIVPTFTFISTATSCLFENAIPTFADIDPRTYCIDPRSIQRLISTKTKIIIPVHLFGQPADLDPILEIAKENKLRIIEDCAQAIGANYKGKKVGIFGDVGCFSFFATKAITTGEGGMLVTDNVEIARKAKIIRTHGQVKPYRHSCLGYNYRMTDIQAAIGLVQLQKVENNTQARVRNALYMTTRLSKLKNIIIPPYVPDNVKHVFSSYVIKLKNIKRRKRFIDQLQERGIDARETYPLPLHLQKIFSDPEEDSRVKCLFNCPFNKKRIRNEKKLCPIAEKTIPRLVSLPIHHKLTLSDMDYVLQVMEIVAGAIT